MTYFPEKYRPKTLDEICGSDAVKKMLATMISTQNLPKCLLFSGPNGTGKTSTARIISTMLNEGEFDPTLCDELDAASNNGVDNIRALQQNVMYAHAGKWRTVVIDEAHGLSSNAFDALLKILEEPPNNTVFILVTTKPSAIPETVRSRAMMFRFTKLSIPDIAHRLDFVAKQENLRIKARVLVRIAEVAEGSMRSALVLLQQLSYIEHPTVEDVNIISGRNVDLHSLMYTMLEGSHTKLYQAVENIFVDSYDIASIVSELFETLKEFWETGYISNRQFLVGSEAVWSMRELVGKNEDIARTQVEAGLFALFAKVFWNGEENSADDVTSYPQLSQADIDKLK